MPGYAVADSHTRFSERIKMFTWEIFIDGYFVELFEADTTTMEEGSVLAGKRARFLLRERNKVAKRQYVLSDISLDYKGYKPKPAEKSPTPPTRLPDNGHQDYLY